MLNKDALVWKFPIKIWWYIYFGLQLFLIAFMIGSLATPRWVHTSSKFVISKGLCNNDPRTYNQGFDGSSFQGSLAQCTQGYCSDYRTETSDWCNIYNDINTGKTVSYCSLDQVNSMCKLFTGLSAASGVFVLFEVIALIAIIVWGSAMLCSYRSMTCYCCVHCCSICTFIAHYIAILGWIGISGSTFSSSCDTFPSNGSMPPICTNDGPGLGLFILIVIPFIVVSFVTVACYAKRNGFVLNNEHNNQNNGVQLSNAGLNQYPIVVNVGPNTGYAQPPMFLPGQGPPVYVIGQGPPIYMPGQGPPMYVPGQGPPMYLPGQGPPMYVPGQGPPVYNNPEALNIIDPPTYPNESNDPSKNKDNID